MEGKDVAAEGHQERVLVRDVEEASARRPAGIVHEDVDVAVLLHVAAHGLLQCIAFVEVGGQGVGLRGAGLHQFEAQGIQAVGAAREGRHDAALAGERHGGGAADALRGTADEGMDRFGDGHAPTSRGRL